MVVDRRGSRRRGPGQLSHQRPLIITLVIAAGLVLIALWLWMARTVNGQVAVRPATGSPGVPRWRVPDELELPRGGAVLR